MISGIFGQCCYTTDTGDTEAGYFARLNDNTTASRSSPSAPRESTRSSCPSVGSFTDSFSIVAGSDSDGDGFSDSVEAYAGTNANDNCGAPPTLGPPSPAWTADLHTGFTTTNRLNVSDLATYVAPVRKLNTSSSGGGNYNPRWDINADAAINIQDLAIVTIVRPAMFAGARAFNGQPCTP